VPNVTIPPAGLPIWVVYDHPSDWPEHYVARLWDGELPTDDLVLTFDLGLLRKHLAGKGLTRLDRQAADDPKIVETWL
jgi:hypothetical protein